MESASGDILLYVPDLCSVRGKGSWMGGIQMCAAGHDGVWCVSVEGRGQLDGQTRGGPLEVLSDRRLTEACDLSPRARSFRKGHTSSCSMGSSAVTTAGQIRYCRHAGWPNPKGCCDRVPIANGPCSGSDDLTPPRPRPRPLTAPRSRHRCVLPHQICNGLVAHASSSALLCSLPRRVSAHGACHACSDGIKLPKSNETTAPATQPRQHTPSPLHPARALARYFLLAKLTRRPFHFYSRPPPQPPPPLFFFFSRYPQRVCVVLCALCASPEGQVTRSETVLVSISISKHLASV
nr:hypothetical protein CFP56_01050 [Quercus suber]